MSDGQLTKIHIEAYKDKLFNQAYSDFPRFELPVNPESYTDSLQLTYEDSQAQGSQGNDMKFSKTEPRELTFEFIFDGTKTIQGYSTELIDMPVTDQIQKFVSTTALVIGETHKTPFLKIFHGEKLIMRCRCTKVDLNYTLFHPNGEPLRAKCNISFKEYIEQERRVREQDYQSPDLTHLRRVGSGDNLPLMTYRIYSNKSLYLQVARENGLTSIRNLREGQEIIFPPIEKTTTS